MTSLEWLQSMAVILTGYMILGITGFGSALIVVPLLARQWPLAEVVALTILLDVPASALHGGLNFRRVQWTELVRLLPAMIAGALLGLWLSGQINRRWLLSALGVYVIAVGLRALGSRYHPPPTDPRWGYLAGLLTGLIEVIFATSGPVVVAWMHRRISDVNELRATVPVALALAGAIALTALAASARIDSARLSPLWLAALPLACAGVILGNKLSGFVAPALMKRVMAGLLTFSGASLVGHAWA